MSAYPQSLKFRDELNLRQGIKSSLPDMKGLISLCVVLYIANGKKSSIEYCVENSDGTLKMDPVIQRKAIDFFQNTLSEKFD